MAYIIPNATETGSGQRYANINQAEPDSVDIEALGNRPNWVRSGCVVSIVSEQVLTTAGVVVIGNVPYSVSAVTAGIAIPRATIGARTDLVVARKSGATVNVQVIQGIDTATNPIFPRSKTIVGNQFNSVSNYDPDNDVLLASVYVTSAETDENNNVDKRIVSAEPVIRYSSSAAVPTSTSVDVIGDVVVASNGIVYVKTGVSTWEAIATRTYADTAGFPVGSIFAWAGQTGQTPGANYLECNGQEVLQSSYPTLYAKIGDIYGAAAVGSFRVPNLSDDRTIIGASSNYGSSVGANSATLAEANIPQHNHGVSVENHDGSQLTHPEESIQLTGGHSHSTQTHYHRGALVYRAYNNHNQHHAVNATSHGTSAFHIDALGVDESQPDNPFGSLTDTDPLDPEETNRFNYFLIGSNPSTNPAGNHRHTIGSHQSLTHTVTSNNFGSATPTAVGTLSKSVRMRWYIRAL